MLYPPSTGIVVILLLLPTAPMRQEPRVYEAARAAGFISIDGEIEDPAWAAAPWTEDFVDILGPDRSSPPLRTRAKLLWDDEYLYVGARMEEPHLWGTHLQRDAIVYQEDDFEVFMDPDGDGLHYFEIEVNETGSILDLFLARPYKDGGTADLAWDVKGLKVAVALFGTINDPSDEDNGWQVEMAIPWRELVPPARAGDLAELGRHPSSGDQWRMNFSRVDWPLEIVDGEYRKTAEPTRENRHPEANWVWSPQLVVDMHAPERWGVVRFVSTPHNSQFDD